MILGIPESRNIVKYWHNTYMCMLCHDVFRWTEKPIKATFVYTTVPGAPQTGSGGQIIYNKNQRQALPWPTTMIPEFLTILGGKYSTFVEDGFLSQSATQ